MICGFIAAGERWKLATCWLVSCARMLVFGIVVYPLKEPGAVCTRVYFRIPMNIIDMYFKHLLPVEDFRTLGTREGWWVLLLLFYRVFSFSNPSLITRSMVPINTAVSLICLLAITTAILIPNEFSLLFRATSRKCASFMVSWSRLRLWIHFMTSSSSTRQTSFLHLGRGDWYVFEKPCGK